VSRNLISHTSFDALASSVVSAHLHWQLVEGDGLGEILVVMTLKGIVPLHHHPDKTLLRQTSSPRNAWLIKGQTGRRMPEQRFQRCLKLLASTSPGFDSL